MRRGLQRIDGELRLLHTKTARSRRTIPLPAMAVDVLRRHRELHLAELQAIGKDWPDLSYVFNTPAQTPIDPRNCTRIVQAECEKAGLRKVRLHDFRHGCVSVLLSLGVPPRTAMEIVWHSTLEMTMTVYGHVTLDDKREAMNRLGGLLEEGRRDAVTVNRCCQRCCGGPGERPEPRPWERERGSDLHR